MADPKDTAEKRIAPRWIKILLGASLAVNLLVIGLGVGAGLRIKNASKDFGGGARGGIAFVAALERDDRRQLVQKTKDARRASQQDGRANMRQILADLRSDSFDIDAFQAALLAQQSRTKTAQDVIRTALVAQVAVMTAGERAAYADRIEAHLQRGKKRHGQKRP